ncbi:hypothetical protein IV203_031204 [Nitzschia inconspicua]|uniref:Uncharacterized protein n=1 Tax=Nitzschia inconspicua TaxID=303405 RepID=A0A9K3LXK5_9STRA|nr:hypothetical protein IV203_031204 [Nitzschia inconspicua]
MTLLQATQNIVTPSLSSRKSFSTAILMMMMVLQVVSSAPSSQDFFREKNDETSSKLPVDCYKSQRLSTYSTNDTDTAYRLTVDLPRTVSRKNLNVDIDYEQGLIEILGWWMEQKVRGERPKKACVYQEFQMDVAGWEQKLEQKQQTASSGGDYWPLYDLVMELQGQQLALSLPKPVFDVETDSKVSENVATSVVARNLQKMVRGLARLNSSLHNVTSLSQEENSDTHTELLLYGSSSRSKQNQSAMSYLQSRQDALERFLRFSLGATDEETYWLKRM